MSYLRYLCLFAHSGVQRILCCILQRLFNIYPQARIFIQRTESFEQMYIKELMVSECILTYIS